MDVDLAAIFFSDVHNFSIYIRRALIVYVQKLDRLFESKEGENFNRRNTLILSRVEI